MFHQWSPDGNLSLDVEVHETDGTIVTRRVTITRDRLASILVEDKEGMRFFMNKVVQKLRSTVNLGKLKPSTLTKVVKVPKLVQQLAIPVSSDDLLSPQIRDLEDRLMPTPEVPIYFFPVKVGEV